MIYYNFVFSGSTSILNSANETIVRNTITTTFPMLVNMLIETISKTHSATAAITKSRNDKEENCGNGDNNNDNDEEEGDPSANPNSHKQKKNTNKKVKNITEGVSEDDEFNNSSEEEEEDDDEEDEEDSSDEDDDTDEEDGEEATAIKTTKITDNTNTIPQQQPIKSSCFDGVFHLFDDICSMTLGEKPSHLRGLPVPFQPSIGLDVIELVLNAHPEAFRSYEEFRALISAKICPAVVRLFDGCESFRVFVRLGRLVNTLASKYMSEAPKDIEALLVRFSSFLQQSTQNTNNSKVSNWQQIVVLEVFRSLFMSPDIVCKMYYHYDMKDSDKLSATTKRPTHRLHLHALSSSSSSPPSSAAAAAASSASSSKKKNKKTAESDEDEDDEDEYNNNEESKLSGGEKTPNNEAVSGDEDEKSDSSDNNEREEEMTDIKLEDDDKEEEEKIAISNSATTATNTNTSASQAAATTATTKTISTEPNNAASTSGSSRDGTVSKSELSTSPQIKITQSQERGGEEKSKLLTRVVQTIGDMLNTFVFKAPFVMEGPFQNTTVQGVIDLSTDTDQAPTTNPRYKVTAALQCLLNLSYSLWSIAGHIPEDVHTQKNIGALITENTYEASFKGFYAALEHASEESTIQFILKGYYNNVYALSVYGLEKGIALYVNSLCKFATYSAGNSSGIGIAGVRRGVMLSSRRPGLTVPLRTIEAMKTLMGIIHCMGSSLSASWRTILLTVESIDKIMAQEAAAKSPATEDDPSDFGIAAVALSTLFESTIQTETESFLIMFAELVKLALERLEGCDTFAEVPGTGRTTCYFFNKVIETAQFNASRTNRIWSVYCDFFRAAIRHPSSVISNSGIKSIEDMMVLTLKTEKEVEENENEEKSGGEEKAETRKKAKKARVNATRDPYSSSTEELMATQTEFFALIEETLFSEEVALKVKVALLDALREALKVVGAELTFGWNKLLETIYNSVKIGDKDIAPTVFTIVQLIGTEFLPRLPDEKSPDLIEKDALYNYIKVVSSYVLQQDNDSISMASSKTTTTTTHC